MALNSYQFNEGQHKSTKVNIVNDCRELAELKREGLTKQKVTNAALLSRLRSGNKMSSKQDMRKARDDRDEQMRSKRKRKG